MSTSITSAQGLLAEFEAGDIIDSVAISGISGSSITIADTLIQQMPDQVMQDVKIQRILGEISDLERTYLPLYQDWRNTRLLNNFEQYIVVLMIALFIVGVFFSLTTFLGLVALLVVLVLAIFHFLVRIRVAGSYKQDVMRGRNELMSKLNELKIEQQRVMGQRG
jgi:hypothetical protein